MKVELNNYYSSDIDDLENYIPQNSDDFGFHLGLFVKEIEGISEDYFQLYVCTPQNLKSYFEKNCVKGDFVRHHFIMLEYNLCDILDTIKKFLTNIEENTWEAVVSKIERVAKSEYEDYQP